MLPWQPFWLSMYGVHIGATWRIRLNVHVRRRCGLMSNYVDRMLNMATMRLIRDANYSILPPGVLSTLTEEAISSLQATHRVALATSGDNRQPFVMKNSHMSRVYYAEAASIKTRKHKSYAKLSAQKRNNTINCSYRKTSGHDKSAALPTHMVPT